MPTKDTVLVQLECGHVRKAPAPALDEHYCLVCEKHSPVVDVTPAYGHHFGASKMPKKWRRREDRKSA